MSSEAAAIIASIREVAEGEKLTAGAHWSGSEADAARANAELLESLADTIEKRLGELDTTASSVSS